MCKIGGESVYTIFVIALTKALPLFGDIANVFNILLI